MSTTTYESLVSEAILAHDDHRSWADFASGPRMFQGYEVRGDHEVSDSRYAEGVRFLDFDGDYPEWLGLAREVEDQGVEYVLYDGQVFEISEMSGYLDGGQGNPTDKPDKFKPKTVFCPKPVHRPVYSVAKEIVGWKSVPCGRKKCEFCGPQQTDQAIRHLLAKAPETGFSLVVTQSQWDSLARDLRRKSIGFISIPMPDNVRVVFMDTKVRDANEVGFGDWISTAAQAQDIESGRRWSSSQGWSGWTVEDESDMDDVNLDAEVEEVYLNASIDQMARILAKREPTKFKTQWLAKAALQNGYQIKIEAHFGTVEWYRELREWGASAKNETAAARGWTK